MISYFRELSIATRESFSGRDVAEAVSAVVSNSGVLEGVAVVSSLHTTCAVYLKSEVGRKQMHFLCLVFALSLLKAYIGTYIQPSAISAKLPAWKTPENPSHLSHH